MNEPPLHWSVDTAQVAHSPVDFSFEASPRELDALKRYAGVEDLTRFGARIKISPLAQGKYRVSGTLEASAVQSSVVNLEAVPSTVEESFSVEYWPAEAIGDAEQDAPFDADPPEPLAGSHIPVGTLLCELFALALDPYPRNPDDKLDWAPRESEPEASPFASLARLKPQERPDKK